MGRQSFLSRLGSRKKQPLLSDKPHTNPEINGSGSRNGSGEERGGNQNRPRLERSHAMPPKRIGEVAGGAAAECAAVCCCCPCTLVNIVLMALYKVPACLCRKAKKRQQRLRRRKQQQSQHGLLVPTKGKAAAGEMDGSREELEREVREVVERGKEEGTTAEKEAVDLEKEMWSRFYGTGFWRSPSQRDT
ncbi:hypothetical protein LINGRAHAP2_LOCUS33538 [Linum grandiflorum]